MPKHEEFTQQQELNLFFNTNTNIPPANSAENKRLVAEAPYHPGYEGAVFDNMNFSTMATSGTEDKITISSILPNNQTISITTNTDPKPQHLYQPIDWTNLVVTGSAGGSVSSTSQEKTGSAMKFDSDKLPVNLLSTEALLQTAAVLKFGADKYHAHNWRDGFAWSRPLAAAMRHIMAYNDGEDKDPESGLSHLAHAACCIMFLLEFEKTHPELDDRYKPNVPTVSK